MKKSLALTLVVITVACAGFSGEPTPVPTPTPTPISALTPTPTAVRWSTPTPRPFRAMPTSTPVRRSTPTPEATSYSVTEGCLAAGLLLEMFDGSVDVDPIAASVYMEAMVTTDQKTLNRIGETVVDLLLSFPNAPTSENLSEIINAFGNYADKCDDLVPRS